MGRIYICFVVIVAITVIIIISWQHTFTNKNNNIFPNNDIESGENAAPTTTTTKRTRHGRNQQFVFATSNNDNNNNNNATKTTSSSSSSPTLPLWMQDYFQWHKNELTDLTLLQQEQKGCDTWLSSHRYLILRCVSNDRCGGTSDRLKSLPFFLLLAARHDRMLFLRWNRPFALEEFLIPGPALNWTVPNELQIILNHHDNTTTNNDNNIDVNIIYKHQRVYFDGLKATKLMASSRDNSTWIVEGNVHAGHATLYQKIIQNQLTTNSNSRFQSNDLEYSYFYHEMFHSIFKPSPPIQKLVQQIMNDLYLVPNQYAVVHYRAKYPGEPYRETWNMTILQQTTQNAIQCATILVPPNATIYVASDAVAVLEAAQSYYYFHAKQQQQQQSAISFPRVVSHLDVTTTTSATILPNVDPPHLNFAQQNDSTGFYSIFVDLIIMSYSRCVTFGAGGFGRFGSLVSFNNTCQMAHTVKGVLQNCSA